MKLSRQSFIIGTAILLAESSAQKQRKGHNKHHAVNLTQASDNGRGVGFVNGLLANKHNQYGKKTRYTFFGISATDLPNIEGPDFAAMMGLSSEERPEREEPNYAKPLEGMHPEYPFENVVFQGGGAKGIIYGGSVIAMDELGILPHVKGVAAASAGCAPALMVALGLDSDQLIAETNKINMAEYFDGAKNVPFGKNIVLGWNAFKRKGMHPAEYVMEKFGVMMEKYTGNPDLTFLELYKLTGRELCIVVSNVSRAQSEFCHVNTTPDMPIRRAMRASMSLPILWQPEELFEGETYVDGGLFTNFPLKAFDGWFLSTKKGDDVISRMVQMNPKVLEDASTDKSEIIGLFKDAMTSSFGEPNPATIGFRASNDESPDQAAYATFLQDLEERLSEPTDQDTASEAVTEVRFPDTKLARAYLKKKSKQTELIETAEKYEGAYVELTRWIVVNAKQVPDSPEHPHAIDTKGFKDLLKSNPPDFSFTIFGYKSWDEFADALDQSEKGYVARSDFSRFWDKFSVRHAYMKNRKPKTLDSLGGLAGELLNSMYNVAEENLLREPENAKRICSLSTKYVGLLDLELEQGDKNFLYEIGKRDTLEWIKKRVSMMNEELGGE